MNVSQEQCEYTKVNSIPACVHSMDSTEANNEVQIQFKVFSFRSSNWRWFTLTIISCVTIGIFFNYDMPNALSDLIREKITHEVDSDNQVKYNQLYSAYSYPNIIMPIICGVIVDKVGLYVGLIIFSLLVASGQGIFTYAGYLSEYKSNDAPFIIALIGRLIYGLGSESLIVCQYTLVSKWFIDSQISFALSIILCISWLGNCLTGCIIPPIADKTSLGFALNIGAITAFISLILVMFLIAFDIYADKRDKANGYQKIEENDKFQCKDIKELGLIYWITVFNCLCCYTGLMFNTFSNDFFKVRYGFDQVEAGRLCSNAWLVSIAFIPLFGYISDRFGHRITFLIFATSTLTLSNILFILIPSSTSENKSYYGLIPVCMNGIASSVYASVLFPTTPMLVKPHVLGTAYGLFSSCVCIGLAVGPIIVGFLTFNSKNECTYDWVNVSMACFCMIGVIFSIFLLFLNKLWLNNLLQKPSKYIQIESQQRLQTKNSEISSND